MKRNIVFAAIAAVIVSVVLSTVPAWAFNRFINVPSDKIGGSWSVDELTRDHDGRTIESFKVDRDLVVWTERDNVRSIRYLWGWNGISASLLASMPFSDWQGSDFYSAIEGNYDVADGIAVWTMVDGSDSEIYAFRDGRVTKITDNGFSDLHPITSGGRIAWTGDLGSVTKLMVLEIDGRTRTVDQYHVMDYTFSGSNLYWMNIRSGETVQRVMVDAGNLSRAVGYGEVRPLDYPFFAADGKGGVAWRRLETAGNIQVNVFYVSDGVRTSEVLRRERWANDVRFEDVSGSSILVNSSDVRTKNIDDVTLLKVTAAQQSIVQVKTAMAKVRFSDDAYVRHVLPETSSPLLVRHNDGFETWISDTRIERDLFDAGDNTIAGAMHDHGGVVLYNSNTREVTETDRNLKARQIVTNGDTVVWLEGTSGNSILMAARPSILVGNSSGAKTVAGRLVKSSVDSAVYLATPDGERFIFPTEGEFYSWYDNFDSLTELSVEEMSSLSLAGAVLYPVGALVKSPSSPKVYAVGGDGRLNWLADADIVTTYYGSSWNRLVRDMPESFLAAYRSGRNVASTGEYYTIAATK